MTPDYTIVIPSVGRDSLRRLILTLQRGADPVPPDVVVVDDRPRPGAQSPAADDLPVGDDLPVRVLRSGGRGPAAARNVGWRASTTRWVCFLDDDVVPDPDWMSALATDLKAAEAAGAIGSQAVIDVPTHPSRRPTDDERRTARLSTAQWITADMAYRRDMLVTVGGFDERFPRAYREDSDLAARIVMAGGTIVRGERRSTHPVAPATWRSNWANRWRRSRPRSAHWCTPSAAASAIPRRRSASLVRRSSVATPSSADFSWLSGSSSHS